MRETLRNALQRGPVLLDGGLATRLEAMGHDLRDPLWSAKLLLEDPRAIETAHRSFIEAGAQVLTTASYQASLPGLRARGLDAAAALALLERATTLARSAAQGRAWVAASAGPYGAYLADGSEYRGGYDIDDDALYAFHAARLPAFATADIVAFETIPCAREAEAIASACDTLPPGLDAWVSLSCRDDAHACSGEPIETCVRAALQSDRVVAVGVNCTDPGHVLGLLSRIAALTDRPLVAYPNAGQHYAQGRWRGDPLTPAAFAARTQTWIDVGARLVGGCCQTHLGHLHALHDVLSPS